MKKEHTKAKKFGMVIDLDKCTGCGACMVACMAENNVPFKENETNKRDSITWMKVYRMTNGKPFPQTEICFLPRPCQHCEGHGGHSPCVSVCPATATDYDKDTGIVSQIYTRCFGCRYCMEKMLSPNVSPRMRGVVEKCSFCYHRYQRALDQAYMEDRRAIEEDEYQTACTQACPSGAITFGDLINPEHTVYKLKKDPNARRLLERLGTNTKVYYVSSRQWVRRMLDNYLPHEEEGKVGGGHH